MGDFTPFEEGCEKCGYWQCSGNCGCIGEYTPFYLSPDDDTDDEDDDQKLNKSPQTRAYFLPAPTSAKYSLP